MCLCVPVIREVSIDEAASNEGDLRPNIESTSSVDCSTVLMMHYCVHVQVENIRKLGVKDRAHNKVNHVS